MSNFASRLREYRGKAGLTQKQAASKLGLAWRTWQDYELGKRRPTFEGLIALADFFGVPVEFLVGNLDSELCTTIAQIAAREDRTAEEQMSLFLKMAVNNYMEENDCKYYPDVDEVATEDEYAEYIAILRDACDVPEPKSYFD